MRTLHIHFTNSCPSRWFENLKFILSGVARPTRRGPLFKNTKSRKPQLSRHYGTIHLSISFHRFDVRYWMSVGVKKGFHLSGEQLYLSSGVCVSMCWCYSAAVLPACLSPHLVICQCNHFEICLAFLSTVGATILSSVWPFCQLLV